MVISSVGMLMLSAQFASSVTFPVYSPSLSRFEIERSLLRRPSRRTIDKKTDEQPTKSGPKAKAISSTHGKNGLNSNSPWLTAIGNRRGRMREGS